MYQGVIQELSNLSLRVPEGSIVTLLGANGAGKTTTLKAISNFLPLENGRVTRGSITIGGENILKLAPHMIVRRGSFHVREGGNLLGNDRGRKPDRSHLRPEVAALATDASD